MHLSSATCKGPVQALLTAPSSLVSESTRISSEDPTSSKRLHELLMSGQGTGSAFHAGQGSGPDGSDNAHGLYFSKRQPGEGLPTDRDTKRQRMADEGLTMDTTHPALLQAAGMQGAAHSLWQGAGNGAGNGAGFGGTQPSLASNLLVNDQMMRAELRARLLQRDMANRNAALLASLLGQPQGQGPPLGYASLQQHQQHLAQGNRSAFGGPVDNFFSGLSTMNHHGQQPSQLPMGSHGYYPGDPMANMAAGAPVDVNSVLRQLSWPHPTGNVSQGGDGFLSSNLAQSNPGFAGVELPPCEEGVLAPSTERQIFPLGIDEDPNWLSEFHCFVRSELVEICRASHDDCKSRNNATSYHQVGIRCRFCAHMAVAGRGCRSSAFSSSLRQIYQSFTMMLRDHFSSCDSMPAETKQRFLMLKDKPSQGATDSKRYWIYSGMKVGLADSPEGIIINQHTVLAGRSAPPFGSESPITWQKEAANTTALTTAADAGIGSEFLRFLMSQARVVNLRDAERIGNRRSLEQGLPGFSCRHCWEKRRLGLCRMFPARRRTLAQKVMDLHDHMRRCQVAPVEVREQLAQLRKESSEESLVDGGDTKALLDRIWSRLGHGRTSI